MRRFLCALLVFCLLGPLCAQAAGEREADDITKRCVFGYSRGAKGRGAFYDGSYLTVYSGRYLDITAPEDAPCHGVYINFAGVAKPFAVESLDSDGQWTTLAKDASGYAQCYVPLPGVCRLRLSRGDGGDIAISEIRVLGEGVAPSFVHDWRAFEGKADLMVLSAHADDELLFFGGTIPYYAAERGKRVIVCYLTEQTSCRRSELLDGLWLCGVREYPVMGVFKDIKNNSLADSYAYWGRENVLRHVAGLIRAYRPDVLVTHDIRGEYGHGAHRVCADAAIRCFALAADAGCAWDALPTWQVKKLYLHLYQENAVVMDWRRPLAFFDGRTAFDIAVEAFKCHDSQRSNGLVVDDAGGCANNRFGLYASTVGADERGDDFFENIP